MWRNQADEESGQARKQRRWTRWGARKAETSTAAVSAPIVGRSEPARSAETPVIAGMQRRTFVHALALEKRLSEGRMLYGAIPFNTEIAMVDGYVETFRPGAFAASIEADDPRVLAFLNSEMVLGRKSAGTATFREDRTALRFEVDVPGTSYGNDLLISIGRGDVDAVDVIFRVMAFDWGRAADGSPLRVITRAELICASVTGYGKFQTAQVDAKGEIAAARLDGFKAGLAQAEKRPPASPQANPISISVRPALEATQLGGHGHPFMEQMQWMQKFKGGR